MSNVYIPAVDYQISPFGMNLPADRTHLESNLSEAESVTVHLHGETADLDGKMASTCCSRITWTRILYTIGILVAVPLLTAALLALVPYYIQFTSSAMFMTALNSIIVFSMFIASITGLAMIWVYS